MNLDHLRQKLIRSARGIPANDAVPYAFEKRVMAHLKTAVPDRWFAWSQALWKGALSCMGIMLLAGVWAIAPVSQNESSENLAQDFEGLLFSSLDAGLEDVW